MEAREKMANAATMAGMAFANAFLGVCHSMAHKLGAFHHLPHGVANALLIEEVIRFNSEEVPPKMGTFPQYAYPHTKARYAEVADYLNLGGANDDEKVALLIAYLRKMSDELNIPHCIKNYGADSYPCENGFVPENVFLERLPEIAKNAIADACTGSNPRQPSQEEMEKLLLACYYDREIDF